MIDTNKVDSLIFDLDGTLWNCIEATYAASAEAVQKNNFNFEITREQIIRGMGKNRVENAHIYMPSLEEEEGIRVMGEINEYRKKYVDEKHAFVYENVNETLKSLAKKYKLFIASNCGKGYIECFLEFSKMGENFTDHIAAGEHGIKKSDAIRKLIDKHNLQEPVYVGDTYKDKEAANEAEIPFIHAKYGFEENLENDIHIERFADLTKLFT